MKIIYTRKEFDKLISNYFEKYPNTRLSDSYVNHIYKTYCNNMDEIIIMPRYDDLNCGIKIRGIRDNNIVVEEEYCGKNGRAYWLYHSSEHDKESALVDYLEAIFITLDKGMILHT